MQEAITWANLDPDVFRHMASLSRNELTYCGIIKPCHGGTTEEGNCSDLLPLSHRDVVS